MTESDRLATLHPHRPPPEDITYRHQVEASNCDWCRWQSRDYTRKVTTYDGPRTSVISVSRSRDCLHPERVFEKDVGSQPGLCSDWNRKGDCDGYAPTLWTKLLRVFGLRGPAWRKQ